MPSQFISTARKFQLTLETEGKPLMDENRVVVGFSQGKRVQFREGLYTASHHEAKRLGYATETELVNALRDAKSYNAEFFEVGNEPGREHPSLEDQMEAIGIWAAKQDAPKLRAVLAEERETYSRPMVINAAQRALGVLGDLEEGKRPPGKPKAAA